MVWSSHKIKQTCTNICNTSIMNTELNENSNNVESNRVGAKARCKYKYDVKHELNQKKSCCLMTILRVLGQRVLSCLSTKKR